MSEAQSSQMVYLLIFIGILVFTIFAVIALSQLKKNKKTSDVSSESREYSSTPLPSQEVDKILREAQKQTAFPETKDAEVSRVEKSKEPTINLKTALKNTEENFFGRIKKAFSNADKKVVLDEIEEILYTSDLGPTTVQKLLRVIESELSSKEMKDIESVKLALKNAMIEILQPHHSEVQKDQKVSQLLKKATQGPTILMIVGVNGAGKTTSIGKMTAQLASENYKVLVAAGDTFRAAAGGQLKTWTDRAQDASSHATGSVEIFWPENTTDPSAVAFDAITKAKSQNFDYVLLDTAGRLHTQSHLMEELKKVKRVMTKVIAEAPHETWIVLDANSGQNALLQAKEYNQAINLTGVILTKMDGTAKGGVALGVVDQLKTPIKLIGVGEKIGDLRSFDYKNYIDSILGY